MKRYRSFQERQTLVEDFLLISLADGKTPEVDVITITQHSV